MPVTAPKTTYEQAFEWTSTIRRMIEHENTLISQRMNWMWTLQGLLLTSVGLLWKDRPSLVVVCPIIGFISTVSIGYSLGRGTQSISDLLEIARKYKAKLPSGINLPPTIGARTKGLQWLMPNRCLSWMFASMWVIVAILSRL